MFQNQKSIAGTVVPAVQLMSISSFVILIAFLTLFALPYPAVDSAPVQYSSNLEFSNLMPRHESLEFRGNMIALSEGREVSKLVFTLGGLSTGIPLIPGDGSISLNYRDQNQQVNNLPWSWQFQGFHNQNKVLEKGERIKIVVPLVTNLHHALGANTSFEIEVVTQNEQRLSIQRTVPARLDPITDLY